MTNDVQTREARRQYMASLRAANADLRARERRNVKARGRALTRLAQEFPERYEELRLEELRKL